FTLTNAVGVLLAAGSGVEAIACAVTVAYLVTGIADLTVLTFHIDLNAWKLLRSLMPIVGSCIVMTTGVLSVRFLLAGQFSKPVLIGAQTVVGVASYAAVLGWLAPGLLTDLLKWGRSLYGGVGSTTG